METKIFYGQLKTLQTELKTNSTKKVFFPTNLFLSLKILLKKELEIEKTKATFVIAVLKVLY